MKNKKIWILSLGHLTTDINQGALPAMLPFFIAAHDLSYTAAAGIVFCANIASTIIQPLFGYAADKSSRPWLLSFGLVAAGTGLGLTGLCNNYHMIMLMAIVSGIGIAAYHPEAARLVNFEAGDRKNAAMSLFGVGGTIGFAIGPFLITALLVRWGLKGTLLLILPVSLMAWALTGQFQGFKSAVEQNQTTAKNFSSSKAPDNWPAFIRLMAVIIGRSVIFYGLNTFIPIYWIVYLQQSKITGSLALTLFAGSGIFGNLLGGRLADHYGARRVILYGFIALAMLLPAFCLVTDPLVSLLLMVPIGTILYASYSPTIVLGQTYLPNRVGLSSGITLGVAVSIGGAAAPVIGKIADLYGVWQGIVSLSLLPPLLLLAAMTLPEPGTKTKAIANERVQTHSSQWPSSKENDRLILKLLAKR